MTLSDVFPLRFTPFEYYYWLDDCPEYPTVFPVELTFSGPLEREYFEQALAHVWARHPLLSARVDDRSHVPRWIAGAAPTIDWADASVPIAPAEGAFINLHSSTPVRVWVRAANDRARVLFQFHHACCDGLASLQVARDLLAFYKQAAGCEAPPVPEYDSSALAGRGELVGDIPRTPSIRLAIHDVVTMLRLWSTILFRSPQELAAPPPEPQPASHGLLDFHSMTFETGDSAAIGRAAKAAGVTVNDLLLADLLKVLRARNERAGWRGRLRVNVPVNVRRRDERMPAANRIGFAFVTQEAGASRQPADVLASVFRQTRAIKDEHLGMYFLGGLETVWKIPGALRWPLTRNRSFATAVLSNVGPFQPESAAPPGEPWQCGPLVLERITGVPPIRKLTRAAFLAIHYAGRWTFSLRCDPRLFSPAQTRNLLNEFVTQVRATVRSG